MLLRTFVILSVVVNVAVAWDIALSGNSKTVTLNNGVTMPRVNLGTCCGSDPSVGLRPFLAAGGVGIDTAFDYHDQSNISAVLESTKTKRDTVFLTTKIPAGFGNETDCNADQDIALRYVHQNLEELGVDQVDLVLLHAPCEYQNQKKPGSVKDPVASNLALWRGLEAALEQGLTRAIGVSNYKVTHLEGLKGATVPAVNQCEMSIAGSFGQPGVDNATIAYCAEHNIQYEAYGVLKGCPWNDAGAQKIAARLDKSLAQVCLRWVLDRGAIAAAGTGANASTVGAYAEENLDVYNFALNASDMAYLNSIRA
eukprot:g1181.t1